MNQEVKFEPVFIGVTTAQTDINSFKRVLLSIIVALFCIQKYEEDEEKALQLTKSGDRSRNNRIRSITTLRTHIDKYNICVRDDDLIKEPRLKTSNNKANDLKVKFLPSLDRQPNPDDQAQELPSLRDCFNQIANPVPAKLYQTTAKLLGESVRPRADAAPRLDQYVQRVNSFACCQHLTGKMFPYFDPFTCAFTDTNGLEYPSMEEFLTSGQNLDRCEITFLNTTPKPLNDYPPDPRTGRTKPEVKEPNPSTDTQTVLPIIAESQDAISQKSDGLRERYLGHHLNHNRQPVLADTFLTWQKGNLIKVEMKQLHEFRPGAKKYTFTGEANYIINEEKTIYVVLKANENNNLQMQITIERNADEAGQRNGLFSFMKYKQDNTPAIPFGGLVILQTAPDKLDLDQLESELNRVIPAEIFTSDPAQAFLRDALKIRYRVLDQFATLPKSLIKAEAAPWVGLQEFVGRYVCYYMRLSKSPAKFEISQIQLKADGRATLKQPPDNQEFNGYVRVNSSTGRLWIYFRPSIDDVTSKDTIRFMVDKGTSNGQRVFRGIFSSQTMTEKRLVSGRMLMKLLPLNEPWPEPLSVDFKEVNFTHLPDEEDRRFFMEELKADTNLTDGPIWAHVANRLQNNSALERLEKLCTDPTINDKPFNNNHFYYYTFKKETPDEKQFVIERNLVTFHSNGEVTIYTSPTKTYHGYAYHLKNTLRLSLSSSKSGFLEVFLELDDDATNLSNIKILYGMSIWHSTRRLQGKMVVLSRYAAGPYVVEGETYRFTDSTEIARLEAEDIRGGGVISYLRGEINRYMHATTDSSYEHFRPRDQSFRQIHFLIACFYGFRLQHKWADHKYIKLTERALIKQCKHHLDHAFMHGYACDFAGIKLNPEDVFTQEDLVETTYSELFLKHLPEEQRRNMIEDDKKIVEILKRIREIAQEQLFLRQAFSVDGPLNRPELHDHIQQWTCWKDLIL